MLKIMRVMKMKKMMNMMKLMKMTIHHETAKHDDNGETLRQCWKCWKWRASWNMLKVENTWIWWTWCEKRKEQQTKHMKKSPSEHEKPKWRKLWKNESMKIIRINKLKSIMKQKANMQTMMQMTSMLRMLKNKENDENDATEEIDG